MIFTFALAASGMAKAYTVSPMDISISSVTAVDYGADQSVSMLECCPNETAEDETQKPRCVSDNLLTYGYMPVLDVELLQAHHCITVSSNGYILRDRFIRPPIA